MKRTSRRVKFPNGRGATLVGVLEQPANSSGNQVIGHALFAHCFTCGKDLKAIVRISRLLAERGVAVLRFDFTGIGDSEGDFSQTNLTTNCNDIEAAAEYLRGELGGPELLVGHSLGGTAMAMVANRIESAKAIVTIASPSSTQRLARVLNENNPEVAEQGWGTVSIGGQDYLLREQLLDDLRSHDIEATLRDLSCPILMYHSPDDRTLPYEWGLKMFEAAGGTKNFITLDGADHLLVDQVGDVEFVADTCVAWARRYLVG